MQYHHWSLHNCLLWEQLEFRHVPGPFVSVQRVWFQDKWLVSGIWGVTVTTLNLETRLTDSLLEGLAVHITKMVKARISRWGMAPNTRDSGLRLLLWSAQRCCELKNHMNRLRYPMDLKLTQMLFSHGAPHVLQLLNTTLQILPCSSCRHG